MKVTRTERGWAGHFCCAKDCLFRRNTLLECGQTRIVVSTVGMMLDRHLKRRAFLIIGGSRHYETAAFHARHEDGYWDADVTRQVDFDSAWCIAEKFKDEKANQMHEKVVEELMKRLENGKKP